MYRTRFGKIVFRGPSWPRVPFPSLVFSLTRYGLQGVGPVLGIFDFLKQPAIARFHNSFADSVKLRLVIDLSRLNQHFQTQRFRILTIF